MRMLRPLMAVTALASTLALAQAVPTQVSFTGRIVDSGAPVTGNRDFVFKLFPTIVAGTEVWTETRNAIPVTDGAVNVALGASTPLTDAIFDGQTLYLEVTIGTTVLTPRTPVVSVPYALRAGVAGQVGNLTPAQLQRRVASACGVGTAIQSINADGTVVCQAAGAANDAGITTITSITAGAGLTGGGATGNVTLAADFAGSGTATTVSRSDHNHTGTYLPLGPVLACTGTDKVVGLASSGSVICQPDVGATYGTAATGGLVLNSGNLFSLANCAPGQVLLAAAGGTWACSSPATVSSVGATAPLASSGGTTPTISLSGTVPVGNGGTGGSTPVTARAGISAAASGANGDITSLTGLSTPLSAGQGGTGVNGSGTGGNYLRSTGAAWASSPIQATDIPSLVGTYLDLVSAQTVGGAKTFTSTINGSISGSAASFTGSLGGDVTGAMGTTNLVSIRGRALGLAVPNNGNALVWNGAVSRWDPTQVVSTVGTLPPLNTTGGPTPTLSIAQVSAANDGYLSSADYGAFNGKQNRVVGTCAVGSSIRQINADGSVVCDVGMAFKNFAANPVSLTGGTAVDLISGSFTAPSAGFVFVDAGGYCNFGAASTNLRFSIETIPNSLTYVLSSLSIIEQGAVGPSSQGTWHVSKVYAVSAGFQNVYAAALASSGGTGAACGGNMTVMFSPTLLP